MERVHVQYTRRLFALARQGFAPVVNPQGGAAASETPPRFRFEGEFNNLQDETVEDIGPQLGIVTFSARLRYPTVYTSGGKIHDAPLQRRDCPCDETCKCAIARHNSVAGVTTTPHTERRLRCVGTLRQRPQHSDQVLIYKVHIGHVRRGDNEWGGTPRSHWSGSTEVSALAPRARGEGYRVWTSCAHRGGYTDEGAMAPRALPWSTAPSASPNGVPLA
mmetsp:Transcript_60446/g.168885  ORF Transcript_60446/g.168885 Transcript_60446/m.168885 type:complete len:219 (+) Transcript_60446:308-964(+)